MLVALVTNIRYVRTQCALHRAMCTHVAVHCARPGVHCVLSVQKCEWPVESHPPARITPPGGNKCRICWVLVSNVMDYEFIVAVNLYYFSVTLFFISFFCLCLCFFSPLVCLRCVVDLVQPFQQLQKVQLWLQAFLHLFKIAQDYQFSIHFHFFNKVNWHLKWTVFFSCPGQLNKWHCLSVGQSVCRSEPTNNQSLRSIKEWP